MRSLRSRLTHACLVAYPRAWRRRYADEVVALMEELDAGPMDLVDLFVVGLRRRFDDLRGDASVTQRINPWAVGASACAALLLAAPTAVFMLVNLLPAQVEWITGVRVPLSVGVGFGLEWILPALPLVALLVAVGPALRVAVSRPQEGGLAMGIRVHALPPAALAVVILCAVLVLAVIGYGISDAVLEGRARV